MDRDWIGIVVSYVYAGSLLAIAEMMRRFLQVTPEITRKFIHIGAGMWIFGVLMLFQTWELGLIPFGTFIIINLLLYRYRIIGAMDTEDSSPGTVYFAISVTLLFALFWRPTSPLDRVVIATASVMAMTWGDALAALIGKRFGKHKYQIWQATRTWEGSIAMFVASTTAIFFVLWLLPGSFLSPLAIPFDLKQTILGAGLAGAIATLAEALSPHGTDNLSVPLVTATVLWLVI